MVFDLLIKYKDGKCDTVDKVIKEVTSYGYLEESSLFYFDKNNHRSFMPQENIIYFGREHDWNN